MEEPTRLILVRHGETDWNSLGQYQGHSDVGLSQAGVQQAVRLRERLRRQEIAGFYASDLRRAMETAVIIAAPHGKEVYPLPALREINFGVWEGLTHSQVTANYPEQFKEWCFGAGDVCVPGGESFLLVKERAWAAAQELLRRHPGETVAVVSHGGTIRALLCAALNVGTDFVWRLAQDNTAVNIINFYRERAVVVLLNDTCHLEDRHKGPGL